MAERYDLIVREATVSTERARRACLMPQRWTRRLPSPDPDAYCSAA